MSVYLGVFVCDYGFTNHTVAAGAGINNLFNHAIISPVTISSAGEYTCTLTVIATDFCQGVDSKQVFTPKTSDTVTLSVECV